MSITCVVVRRLYNRLHGISAQCLILNERLVSDSQVASDSGGKPCMSRLCPEYNQCCSLLLIINLSWKIQLCTGFWYLPGGCYSVPLVLYLYTRPLPLFLFKHGPGHRYHNCNHPCDLRQGSHRRRPEHQGLDRKGMLYRLCTHEQGSDKCRCPRIDDRSVNSPTTSFGRSLTSPTSRGDMKMRIWCLRC